MNDDEKIEVDGINYTLRDLQQLIRSIKKGCPIECMPLSALQRIECDRRIEMDRENERIKQEQYQQRIIQKDIE